MTVTVNDFKDMDPILETITDLPDEGGAVSLYQIHYKDGVYYKISNIKYSSSYGYDWSWALEPVPVAPVSTITTSYRVL